MRIYNEPEISEKIRRKFEESSGVKLQRLTSKRVFSVKLHDIPVTCSSCGKLYTSWWRHHEISPKTHVAMTLRVWKFQILTVPFMSALARYSPSCENIAMVIACTMSWWRHKMYNYVRQCGSQRGWRRRSRIPSLLFWYLYTFRHDMYKCCTLVTLWIFRENSHLRCWERRGRWCRGAMTF